MIEETTKLLPEAFLHEDIDLQMLMLTRAAGSNLPPSTHLGLPFNVHIADVIDYCFLTSGIFLNSFVPVIEDGTVPSYNPGFFGVYNPKADRAKMSVAEKFNEDKILLAELLPEYAIVPISNPPMPVWDEMTLGFSDFIQTKKPSLWLSFAAQLLLDSIHATRHTRMRPFDDLRMTALRIGRTIDDHRKLSATHPRPAFWPKEGDELIDSIRSDITGFIEKDALLTAKTAMSSALGKPNRSTDHLLFIRNPTLCGIFAFHFQLHMQTVGQSLVTQWFDVQQLAILYGLVQSVPTFEGLSWPDMELFIKIHGEDHIFMGSRASNAEQALARLEMVTGISSATRFASNSRRVKSDFHTPDGKSGRRLTPTTKTANLLRSYYAPDYKGTTARHSIDGTSLSKYLNELFEATSSGKSKSGQVEVSKARTEQLLGSKWRNQRNVGFVQLLALMKAQLCEEEPYLQFNYLAMHRRSIELLRLIREKEHHKFVQYFTDRYLPDESFISNIVILILHVARGSAMASQELGFAKSTGGMTGSRIVVSCAGVMRGYLEKNGESILKELRTFCKNKAPLDLNDSKKPEDTASSQRELYWTCIDEILSPAEMESLRTGISLA